MDSKDININELKRKLHTARQTIRRMSSRIEKRNMQLTAANATGEGELAIAKKGRSNHLTSQGAFALAIRRNIGTCSANSLGAVLLDSLHHTTECEAEVKAAASLLGASRNFHQDAWEQLEANASKPTFQFQVYAVRGDATNSLDDRVHNVEVATS